METPKSKFSFIGYNIVESHLKMSPNQISGDDFNFNINPSGIKRGNKFYLTLDTTLSAKDNSFEAKVIIIGEFEFDITQDQITPFFTCNAPAIMFPYIRAYISSLTALSGAKTIVIPTLNMQGLGKVLSEFITDE